MKMLASYNCVILENPQTYIIIIYFYKSQILILISKVQV